MGSPTYTRAPAPQSSPYLAVAPQGPASTVGVVPSSQLREITTALIARAAYLENPLVIATIPEALAADRDDERFATMAAAGATVVLLGRKLERYVSQTGREPHRVPLRPDDPLWTEWNVVVCARDVRSAFVARAKDPEALLDEDCAFGWAREREPQAVASVARILLERTPHLRVSIPPYRARGVA